jgi:hypothetical protein
MPLYDRLATFPEGPAPHPYPPPAPPDVPLPRWQAYAGPELVAAEDDYGRLVREVTAAPGGDLVVWYCGGGDPWHPHWRVVAVVRPLADGTVRLTSL